MSAHANASTPDDPNALHEHHVCSPRLLLNVLLVLLGLTIVTVAVSRVDFGGANLLIAMAVAAIKASLVLTFFMHLKWDTAINNITIISSFLFLALLFLFTLGDLATRGTSDKLYDRRAPLPNVPDVFTPVGGHGGH
jgi:caa(3)-type oxidase subunit IV